MRFYFASLLLLVGCLAMCPEAIAQPVAYFEGMYKVRMEKTLEKERSYINCFTSQGNHLLEVTTITPKEAFSYQIIFKAGEPIMYMLIENDEGKLAYETPIATLKGDDEVLGTETLKAGMQREINGFACSEYSGKSNVRYWAAQSPTGLTLSNIAPLFSAPNYVTAAVKNGADSFPIRIEASNTSGQLLYVQELLEINPAIIKPDMFVIPSGYKRIKVN
jgi:hypothetical protein